MKPFDPLPHIDAEISDFMPQLKRAQEASKRSLIPGTDFVDPGDDDDFDPGAPYKCWCGQDGTYAELCDQSGLERTCGGLGTLNCFCGGDQCVCHHHGEVECPGCEECEPGDDSEEYDEP